MTARLRSFFVAALLLSAVPAFAPFKRFRVVTPGAFHDWMQFNGDAQHSGAVTGEAITPENVAKLLPLFHTKLPAVSDGAPAYWTAGSPRRLRHVLFFTMTDGSLMAVHAASGAVMWQTDPPAGTRWTTSSPAIDPSLRFVYSYALDGRIHRYDINTGAEAAGGGWPAIVTRKGDVEKGSSALTIATRPDGSSLLYATFAGYPDPGDAGDYQGHIVAIRLDDGTATTFNALCSDKSFVLGNGDCAAHRAGIWGRSALVYDDADDALYVITSNGPWNGKTNWGDSVLRLPPDLRGVPLDSYTPTEHATLAKNDLDLGSGGLGVAGGYGVFAGKDGIVRLVRLADLSGHHAAGWSGGEAQRIPLPQGGEVLTAPAVWTDSTNRTWIVFANDYGTTAFELVNGHLVERWTSAEPSRSSPLVVNGVVFEAENGKIFALDITSGNELWSDTSIGNIHWESPIVAGGAVYISDFEGNLYAWSLPGEIVAR